MTPAEYLKARGWYRDDVGDWFDPRETSALPVGTSRQGWEHVDGPLIIQRARDEEECRAAWVQFAAVMIAPIAAYSKPADTDTVADVAGKFADALLAAFRARFVPEVQP